MYKAVLCAIVDPLAIDKAWFLGIFVYPISIRSASSCRVEHRGIVTGAIQSLVWEPSRMFLHRLLEFGLCQKAWPSMLPSRDFRFFPAQCVEDMADSQAFKFRADVHQKDIDTVSIHGT